MSLFSFCYSWWLWVEKWKRKVVWGLDIFFSCYSLLLWLVGWQWRWLLLLCWFLWWLFIIILMSYLYYFKGVAKKIEYLILGVL